MHLAKNKRKFPCSHSFRLKPSVDFFVSYKSFLQRDFFLSYHTSYLFSYRSFQICFSPCLASCITAFLCFTHLSVWVGWLSVVFPSVCYCALQEISFGCLSVQKSNCCLTVSTFVSRFLSLLVRTHQTQQTTKSPMSPKPDMAMSPSV